MYYRDVILEEVMPLNEFNIKDFFKSIIEWIRRKWKAFKEFVKKIRDKYFKKKSNDRFSSEILSKRVSEVVSEDNKETAQEYCSELVENVNRQKADQLISKLDKILTDMESKLKQKPSDSNESEEIDVSELFGYNTINDAMQACIVEDSKYNDISKVTVGDIKNLNDSCSEYDKHLDSIFDPLDKKMNELMSDGNYDASGYFHSQEKNDIKRTIDACRNIALSIKGIVSLYFGFLNRVINKVAYVKRFSNRLLDLCANTENNISTHEFRSFDIDEFYKAIENKDYGTLKFSIMNSISSDPTFERGETDKAIKILEEKCPEIFEEYKDLGYEERLDPSDWDKEYFSKLTYWLTKNFSKERIPYIKKVGKTIHLDTSKTFYKSRSNVPGEKDY